jgi:hypothetical protein
MPAKSIPRERIEAVVEIVEGLLLKGFRPPDGSRGRNGVLAEAGREVERRKWKRPGAGAHHVRLCITLAKGLGIAPDWNALAPPKKSAVIRQSVSARIVSEGPRWPSYEKGRAIRIAVIPDVHLSPEINPERMKWIGKWCADEAPDDIVQLGDLATFDSVTMHAPPGTLEFSKLPRVNADFEAVERGLDLLHSGLGSARARLTITKGNHEFRLDRFEDRNPQIQGLLVERFDSALEDRGWRVLPFRKYAMIGGVGFIHIPINAGGRPYGGKMSAHAIARDALFSIVHGHTHVRQSAHVAKIGESRLVSVISPGCALPSGHVEDYAKHNATGWFWGVSCLTVRDGVILDEHHISMETPERRYRERKKAPAHAR